ncbi:MAG: hypothetical protein WA952_08310 [Lewinella sp.]
MSPSLLLRRLCFCAFFFTAGTHATAQSFIEKLATEVCNCLSAEELIYPRIQANRCLETVVGAYPRQIRTELKLSIRRDEDRKQLEALLIDPLSENCTALQNLAPEKEEPKLRYTDIPLARRRASTAEKHPPADDRSTLTAEAPRIYRLIGELTAYDGDRLKLRTEDGKSTITIHIEDRQLRRQLELTVGNRYTITYRMDWRSDDNSVLRILEDVN